MTEKIGHNSGISGERLRGFIRRIEKLEEDKAAISEDLKEVYAAAKGTGFDTPTIRKIIKVRKEKRKNAQKFEEQLELFDLYAGALGMEV